MILIKKNSHTLTHWYLLKYLYDSEQLNRCYFMVLRNVYIERFFRLKTITMIIITVVCKVLFCVSGYKASLAHKQCVIYRRKRSDSFSVERPTTETSANRWRRFNVSTAPAENLRCRIVETDFARYVYSLLKSARLYDNATNRRRE